MRINIVSAIGNGLGLQQDFQMLGPLLQSWGHDVEGIELGATWARESDLTIFDEVAVSRLFGKKNWVLPHPEWWFPEWDDLKFDKILAKTRDCQRLFPGSEYICWKSRDMLDPSVQREDRFLHVAGGSKLKNTEAVVSAWREHDLPPITIVAAEYNYQNVPNATILKRVSDEELRVLMNSHRFHIVPSGYEGWGHVLHEALGVGATLITTDAPPMNEIGSAVKIPTCKSKYIRRATIWEVHPDDVADAVRSATPLDSSRAEFEMESVSFERRFKELLEST